MIDDVLRDVWHLVTKLRNERFIRDENDCRVKSHYDFRDIPKVLVN